MPSSSSSNTVYGQYLQTQQQASTSSSSSSKFMVSEAASKIHQLRQDLGGSMTPSHEIEERASRQASTSAFIIVFIQGAIKG